ADERDAMAAGDRATYERLIDEHVPAAALEGAMPETDEESRHFLAQMIRNPLFNASLERAVAAALARSPLEQRIEAMPQLHELLPTDAFEALVDSTLESVLGDTSDVDELVARLGSLAAVVSDADR